MSWLGGGVLLLTTTTLVVTTTLMPPDARFAETCAAPSAPGVSARVVASDEPTSRVGLGLSPGFRILEESSADLRADLDAMERLGITRLRVDLSWAALQPERDRFDWSSADRVLGEAQARGLDVLAVVGYEPDWARRTDAAGDPLPVDPAAFAEFVGQAATRYEAPVGAWEIWNEPNLRRFWGTAPDPASYAAVVTAASPRIRSADPGAPIVIGALSPANDTADGLSPATFVSGVYDHVDIELFDAISVHPYSYPAQATGRQRWNTFYRLNQVHQIMARRGDGETLVWLTEYGAPTGTSAAAVSDQAQAEMITTGIQEARRRCYTGPIYLYSLRDAGPDLDDPEDNFGLVRDDRTPKASYLALLPAAGTGQPSQQG